MKKTNYIIFIITICILLVGCENKYKTYVVPVQEYTGKEYLAKDKEQWDYVEEHKEVFEEYAIQWFKEKYQLDVKVNFTYPHIETETVISTVEWIEDSDLKMCIVMGVDKTNHKVMGVNETVMQLEVTFISYLTHRIYEEEFHKLEEFLKGFAEQYKLLGVTEEYINYVGGFVGFRNQYYRYSSRIDINSLVYTSFLENPKLSTKQLRKIYEYDIQKNQKLVTNIMVELYSKDDEINTEIYKILEAELKAQEGLPDVNYAISLCKNSINLELRSFECKIYPEYPTKNGYIRIRGE